MDKQTVKAVLRYARLSPRKARMMVDLVRGKKVTVAEAQLKWQIGKVSPVLLKLLNSAVANAIHNFKLNKEDLIIKSFTVDSGPVLKRYTPKAFGRATPIRKPTSHITIVLESTNKSVKKNNKEETKSEKTDEKKVAGDEKKVLPNTNKQMGKNEKLDQSVNRGKKLPANKPISKTTKQKV